MDKDAKYDLIFGIGEACSCTQALRQAGLQIASYPMDWLYGADFYTRCKILSDNFNRFIDKDDLEFFDVNRSIKCNAYINKQNGLIFNHDFLSAVPFDDMYKLVKQKYDRRIKRLINQINKANKILIVYIETPETNHASTNNEDIIASANMVTSSINGNKKIDFIYLSNKKVENKYIKLAENIIKIECDYKDYTSELDYIVRNEILLKIFERYKLNISKGYFFKQKMLKLLINFIPIKSKRKELRGKFHVK